MATLNAKPVRLLMQDMEAMYRILKAERDAAVTRSKPEESGPL
jgi:hypothetical protein